jgi:hypothetical protein
MPTHGLWHGKRAGVLLTVLAIAGASLHVVHKQAVGQNTCQYARIAAAAARGVKIAPVAPSPFCGEAVGLIAAAIGLVVLVVGWVCRVRFLWPVYFAAALFDLMLVMLMV